jgi:hypothetical protein
VELDHGGTRARYLGHDATEGIDVGGALQVIEAVGWRLDQAGYVFQPTLQKSHLLTDTQHVTGRIIGIYTFRRPL